MLSMHTSFALPHARREPAAPGIAPALMGGWIGGTILGAMALWFGLGWLAALATYGLGGATLLVVLAVLPELDLRPNIPVMRPVFVRVRRGRG